MTCHPILQMKLASRDISPIVPLWLVICVSLSGGGRKLSPLGELRKGDSRNSKSEARCIMGSFTRGIQNLLSAWGSQALFIPRSGCPGYRAEYPFLNCFFFFKSSSSIKYIITPTVNFKTSLLMSGTVMKSSIYSKGWI